MKAVYRVCTVGREIIEISFDGSSILNELYPMIHALGNGLSFFIATDELDAYNQVQALLDKQATES